MYLMEKRWIPGISDTSKSLLNIGLTQNIQMDFNIILPEGQLKQLYICMKIKI